MNDQARTVDEIVPDTYRQVLGHVPTGVVVLTATGPEGPLGMACNSFTSVSLAPPLVSFCAARTSLTWPQIRATGHFCVNVMASHHIDATRGFARRGHDRFRGVTWYQRHGGPGIVDAVAWIDCDIVAQYDAGDHVIVLGRVRALDARADGTPLVFWRGEYGDYGRTHTRVVS